MKPRSALLFLAALAILLGNDGVIYAVVHASANDAVRHSRTIVESQAAGECYRVNITRAVNDRSAHARWLQDVQNIALLRRQRRQLPRVERALHLNPHSHIVHALIRASIAQNTATIRRDLAAAKTELFAPWTDCRAALANPSSYRPTLPLPFRRALQNPTYRRELRSLPPNPRQGHY